MPRKRPTSQLAKLFEQSPGPIYVVDDSRKLIYLNAACATWLGIEASQLAGRRCDYHSGEAATRVGAAIAALCPPPQTFLGETAVSNLVWKDEQGTLSQRSATFVPMARGEREVSSVIAVVGEPRPIDETQVAADTASADVLHQRLQQIARQMRQRYRLDRLVGDSSAIRRVRDQVRAAIASRSRVLLVGPPGSGREHIARTIHYGESPDTGGPLLPLLCESLDAELLQATVLAFLRRCQDQHTAASATVLLLDADSLSPPAQAELLSFFRVPTWSLRTISTARKPLVACIEDGFAPELAYLLSTMEMELPALRDRREDVPLLAQRFVEEFNASGGRQLAGFAPAAIDRLGSLPWHGDVEELATVVREACQQVTTVWIGESDLPARVRAVTAAGAHPRRAAEPIRLDEFLVDVERELIQRAMKRSRGNKAKAARLLGISRPRLLRRLTQLGLEPQVVSEIDFKPIDEPVPEQDRGSRS